MKWHIHIEHFRSSQIYIIGIIMELQYLCRLIVIYNYFMTIPCRIKSHSEAISWGCQELLTVPAATITHSCKHLPAVSTSKLISAGCIYYLSVLWLWTHCHTATKGITGVLGEPLVIPEIFLMRREWSISFITHLPFYRCWERHVIKNDLQL